MKSIIEENIHVCKKCECLIIYKNKETIWDENGYGYSAKLILCPNCGTHNVIKYEKDNWLKEF